MAHSSAGRLAMDEWRLVVPHWVRFRLGSRVGPENPSACAPCLKAEWIVTVWKRYINYPHGFFTDILHGSDFADSARYSEQSAQIARP